MQRLQVYQSMWAMELRRPDGFEWTLDQKLQMIIDAGFDGAGVRFTDRELCRHGDAAAARRTAWPGRRSATRARWTT
jgi:hypothetical protein